MGGRIPPDGYSLKRKQEEKKVEMKGNKIQAAQRQKDTSTPRSHSARYR